RYVRTTTSIDLSDIDIHVFTGYFLFIHSSWNMKLQSSSR
ncbi:unnamed protein product, partial [Rotaria magnacalcarata]